MSQDNVLLVITAITGILGVPVVTWLKTKFAWEDGMAFGLAVGVSFALGLVIAFVNGQITGTLVDPKQVGDAFGVVFTTATILFKMLTTGKKE